MSQKFPHWSQKETVPLIQCLTKIHLDNCLRPYDILSISNTDFVAILSEGRIPSTIDCKLQNIYKLINSWIMLVTPLTIWMHDDTNCESFWLGTQFLLFAYCKNYTANWFSFFIILSGASVHTVLFRLIAVYFRQLMRCKYLRSKCQAVCAL